MLSEDYLTRHDMETVPREPSLNSKIETPTTLEKQYQ
jgi:hypothetical protein